MKNPNFIDDREKLEKLAPVLTAPVKRQIFVCSGKSCSKVGSADVKAAFSDQLEARHLRQGKKSKGRNPMGEVVLTDCGSIGLCTVGPAVIVLPECTWYGQVSAEDVSEIIEQHIEKGQIVKRLEMMSVPNVEPTKP